MLLLVRLALLAALLPLIAAAQAPGDWTVTLRTIGPVRFGMTTPEAGRAVGAQLLEEESGDCQYGYRLARLPGIEFGRSGYPTERVSHVHVTQDARYVRTRSGIGIGSTPQEVRRAYPGQIRERAHPHRYANEGRRVLEFQPRDRADRAYALLFEIDEGRVSGILVGEREAVLMDPCGAMEGM